MVNVDKKDTQKIEAIKEQIKIRTRKKKYNIRLTDFLEVEILINGTADMFKQITEFPWNKESTEFVDQRAPCVPVELYIECFH